MATLIDGYNLMYAMGLVTPHTARHALRGARRSLLMHLHAAHGDAGGEVTVVFDALGAPPGLDDQAEFHGVRVRFAQGQTADDLLEDLIRSEQGPRRLTVVSDDHRIQKAARRRGCTVLGCLDYCDLLLHGPPRPPAPEPDPAGKPDRPTAEEAKRWLETFGELEEPT
jgi:predicted RNA-binding protein with PIN domain